MTEWDRWWLRRTEGSDSAFLKSVGIEPCVIDDPCPGPLLLPYRLKKCFLPTEADSAWLKACGAAWDKEPTLQLHLGFCVRHENP